MLYFLSGLTRTDLNPATLASRGLPVDLRDPSKVVQCNVPGKGPNGSSGVIVSAKPHTGYYPDRQTWHDFGDVWVGWETRPTPASLRREHLITGYDYELGDGNVWTCPVLRAGDRINLPTSWGVDADGNFTTRVLPEFADDLDAAAWIFDVAFGDAECSTLQAWETACRLLAVNYQLCPRGVSALGLITSSNYAAIFKAAIDGPAIETLCADELATVAALNDLCPEKKNTGGQSDISHGQGDGSNTPPVTGN